VSDERSSETKTEINQIEVIDGVLCHVKRACGQVLFTAARMEEQELQTHCETASKFGERCWHCNSVDLQQQ